MGNAKLVSMIAQPAYASYLGFAIGGILDTRQAQLGEVVRDVPHNKFSDYVRASGTINGDPSRLAGDSQGVMQIAAQFALATLRNEELKASLDSAVNTRQNIYFAKYANAASVISTMRAYYYRTSPTAKPNRLNILSDIAQKQAMDLQEAYTEDDRMGVVKATKSCLDSTTRSVGGGTRAGKFYQESVGKSYPAGTILPKDLPVPWEGAPKDGDPAKQNQWINGGYPSHRFTTAGTGAARTTGVNYEESNSGGSAVGTQSATHVDYEYRTPFLEAHARNNRAQISLIDQKFESFMFEQNMPHLERIFENELASVDNDVYQFQLALLRSVLVSPLPGVVTGVYKNPGDAVSPGEPVIRVEDNGVVNLVANLVRHGAIRIGDTATVTTTLGGAANAAIPLNGRVTAARGQGSGGRWEVVIEASNVDLAGNHILPINYCFDAEFTEITLV
jgi:biotin carboxyl carrier protein